MTTFDFTPPDQGSHRVALETHAMAHLRRRFAEGFDWPPTGCGELISYFLTADEQHSANVDTDLPQPDDQDALAALILVEMARMECDNNQRAAIAAARRLGLTWKQVAEAIGLASPQAAAKRYQGLGGTEP